MAEVILSSRLSNLGLNISVSSAGLGALIDYPADSIAQDLMIARGNDLSAHRARQIFPDLAFHSDLILTMTNEQQRQVEHHFPGITGRVHRLGKWGDFDVPDPFKRPKVIFEQALALIEQGIDEWCGRLWY